MWFYTQESPLTPFYTGGFELTGRNENENRRLIGGSYQAVKLMENIQPHNIVSRFLWDGGGFYGKLPCLLVGDHADAGCTTLFNC